MILGRGSTRGAQAPAQQPMRVLIYGSNYAPELTGIGKYSSEMAEWLAARGHDVRMVTAPPYYPDWRVFPGYRSYGFRREQMNGVEIWRCPLWVPGRPSGVKRLLHLASFALSSLPVLLLQAWWRPERVIVIEPPLMCAPAGLLLARLTRGRAWLHVQDFEVDAAFNLGMLPRFLQKWARHAESFLMRRFDRVSSISRNMVDLLLQKGVEPVRCVLFCNWVDPDEIRPLSRPGKLRQELGISADKTVALYSGNMGMKQGLDIILQAAQSLVSHPRIHFVMCGEGAAKRDLIKDWGALPNVTWLSLQPLDRLNELLNMADIHLLPQSQDVADLVMPSKLAGILASGRPVLATVPPGTQIAEVVETRGVISPPGDAGALAKGIVDLDADAELRARLGTKARIYAVAHLGKQVVMEGFERALIDAGAARDPDVATSG